MPFPSNQTRARAETSVRVDINNSELRAAVSVDKSVLCKSNSRMGACCALIDSRSATKGFGQQQVGALQIEFENGSLLRINRFEKCSKGLRTAARLTSVLLQEILIFVAILLDLGISTCEKMKSCEVWFLCELKDSTN
ncbi:hypothetical protein CDAR_221821 [Caerostris darwini]|uniref:Uncharacterized protein n=1 Tax=Caerostris darwini TaxID=1538125 RepID=A0AAV4MZM0_9ARAC|nr:hypothetical protein CDAR_221821 [Caerostris darwini]